MNQYGQPSKKPSNHHKKPWNKPEIMELDSQYTKGSKNPSCTEGYTTVDGVSCGQFGNGAATGGNGVGPS